MEFTAGIHILVKNGNRYLAIKRSLTDETDQGAWDLPGGGIDANEQPGDSAVREALEETGLSITAGKALSYYALEHQGMWSIELIIEGQYLSGEVKLSPEHDDYRWVSLEDLKALEPKSVHLSGLIKNLNE